MILLVVLPLIAVTIVCFLPRGAIPGRWQNTRGRMRRTAWYRLRRTKLPHDWWEQFERDFAAYVDPRAARARDRERS